MNYKKYLLYLIYKRLKKKFISFRGYNYLIYFFNYKL